MFYPLETEFWSLMGEANSLWQGFGFEMDC